MLTQKYFIYYVNSYCCVSQATKQCKANATNLFVYFIPNISVVYILNSDILLSNLPL